MKKYMIVIFAAGLLFGMTDSKIFAENLIEEEERLTRDGKVDAISVTEDKHVPPLINIGGQLLDGYKAKVKVLNQVYMVDLRTNKKVLEQMNVYKNGQLQKSEELIISEYLQLKPIITTAGKGMRGVQRVQGAIPNKSLGEIISVWYYRDGKWMLQDIDYNSNYKKMYHYIELEQ